MDFNEHELRLYRYTANLAVAVALTGLVVLIVWVFAYVLSTFSALVLPLAIAGVLGLVLQPVVNYAEDHLPLNRIAIVTLLFTVFLLLVGAVLVYVGPTLVRQVTGFIGTMPELLDQLGRWIGETFPAFSEAGEQIMERVAAGDGFAGLPEIGERVADYAALSIGMAFVPLYLFFFLLLGDRIGNYIKESFSVLNPGTRDELIYLGDVFLGYVTAFFRGQFMIALLMGIMFSIGFTLVGLTGSIIIGLILGVLNIVPFLGTIIGVLIVTPLALMQDGGGLTLLALCGLVFFVVQLIESWVLTPKIMGDRSGLHPFVVVISIFFWGIAIDGILGMILAVPLTAFVIALLRHLRVRFLTSVVSEPGHWPEETHVIETDSRNSDRHS